MMRNWVPSGRGRKKMIKPRKIAKPSCTFLFFTIVASSLLNAPQPEALPGGENAPVRQSTRAAPF
jgi:hypothetical protein